MSDTTEYRATISMIGDPVLRALSTTYEDCSGNENDTLLTLLAAASLSGAITGAQVESMCEILRTMRPVAERALRERTDIFGTPEQNGRAAH